LIASIHKKNDPILEKLIDIFYLNKKDLILCDILDKVINFLFDMKILLLKIIRNNHILKCYQEVIMKQGEDHSLGVIRRNLEEIIKSHVEFYFLDKMDRKLLAFTIYAGDIIFNMEW